MKISETESNEFKLVNYEFHKTGHEYYKDLIKKLIKAIPKTELINLLVELNVVKRDFVTKEVIIKNE